MFLGPELVAFFRWCDSPGCPRPLGGAIVDVHLGAGRFCVVSRGIRSQTSGAQLGKLEICVSENLQRKAPPNEGKQLIHGRTGFIGLRVLGHVFGNGGE